MRTYAYLPRLLPPLKSERQPIQIGRSARERQRNDHCKRRLTRPDTFMPWSGLTTMEARVLRFRPGEVSAATHHVIRDAALGNAASASQGQFSRQRDTSRSITAFLEAVYAGYHGWQGHSHRRAFQRQARALQAHRTPPSDIAELDRGVSGSSVDHPGDGRTAGARRPIVPCSCQNGASVRSRPCPRRCSDAEPENRNHVRHGAH